jgi:hypothetical protein
MSVDQKAVREPARSGAAPSRPKGDVASLAPEDAGKHPIKVTRAGEAGSHPDPRSSAASGRST